MRRLSFIIVSLLGSCLLLSPAALAYDPFGQTCSNTNAQSSSVCQDASHQGTNNPVAGKNGVLQKVTDVLALIGGLAAVIMVFLSAITMATSNGETEKVASARKRLQYAVIGLIVIVMAWGIVNYVIGKFT